MTYLLDTNAVIALLGGDRALLDLLKAHRPDDFSVSSIVMHELYYGAYHSRRREENIDRIERLRFGVVAFDREDSRHAGRIRAELAAKGQPIGPNDVLIAGQAFARSLILVTRNLKEFQSIEGLKVQSW